MEPKGKKNETIIMIVSAIVFIVGIVFIVRGDVPFSIFCFTVESILLTLLAYLFVPEPNDSAEIDSDFSEELLNLEQDKLELNQRITALEKELQDKTVELSSKNIALENENKDMEQALSSLKSRTETVTGENFLPPTPGDETENDTIDIVKVANGTVDELKSYAKDAGITVNVSASEESLLVKANSSRMHIMFRNIIDNSIKYMQKSGSLIVTISSIGDDIFIVLKDNGAGLSEDETKHIFELNYQGSNRISGNGLGLTQAKAIVEYYGGTIYAKSNLGRGMGIYIQLPTT